MNNIEDEELNVNQVKIRTLIVLIDFFRSNFLTSSSSVIDASHQCVWVSNWHWEITGYMAMH